MAVRRADIMLLAVATVSAHFVTTTPPRSDYQRQPWRMWEKCTVTGYGDHLGRMDVLNIRLEHMNINDFSSSYITRAQRRPYRRLEWGRHGSHSWYSVRVWQDGASGVRCSGSDYLRG
ncbi:hypothetical protein BDN67DRAFT_961766 [Paxillus ammoniavirescens]|nr:hypothetical protein BDN67DRAFT_961766 [Paxillus ammoniavirescens]